MKAVSDYRVEDNASNLNQALESLSSPGDRMKLIAERYGDSALATTSFGAQSAVMLHLLKEHAPQIPIIFIDTGYLFPETYQFAERLIKTWELNIKVYQPQMSAARLEALYGKLWEQGEQGMEKYSVMTKVEPMHRALQEHRGKIWLSGVRRAQASTRAERTLAEAQKSTIKAYPIVDLSDNEVSAYMQENQLPNHPLVNQGYVSIGDWHSTKPLEAGMTAEQTRFDGIKRECGLHLPSENQDFQI